MEDSEKTKLSGTLLRVFDHQRALRYPAAALLHNILVLNEDRVMELHRMLEVDSADKKRRVFPLRDIRVPAPACLYMALPANAFDDPTVRIPCAWTAGSSDAESVDTGGYVVAITNFTTLFYVGGLFRNLDKRLSKWDKSARTHIDDIAAKMEPEWLDSLWLVAPNTMIDICDVVKVPDPSMLDTLSPIIRNRILSHGIQKEA